MHEHSPTPQHESVRRNGLHLVNSIVAPPAGVPVRPAPPPASLAPPPSPPPFSELRSILRGVASRLLTRKQPLHLAPVSSAEPGPELVPPAPRMHLMTRH